MYVLYNRVYYIDLVYRIGALENVAVTEESKGCPSWD